MVEGDSIKAVNEKSIKLPDKKTLEKMGLDYERVIRMKEWDKNGNTTVKEGKSYINSEENFDFIYVKTEDLEYQYILDNINIVPIVEVYQEDNSFYKIIKLSDGNNTLLEFLDNNNFELLQSSLANKTSFVDAKDRS